MANGPRTKGEPIPGIFDGPEVQRLTSLSRTTIWRLEQQGTFPRRVRLSRNRVGWRAVEILAWMAALPCGGIQ
jgi:prophage regulatory protein